MPNQATPEQIRNGRDTLDRLAKQAGRDPASIQVVAHSAEDDGEMVKALGAAGADRVDVRLVTTTERESLEQMEQVAREVLG